MRRWITGLFAALAIGGAAPAFAQETASGAGTVVVTIIPAGATFFTEGKETNGPSFGNYELGGAVAFNVNRYVGFEADVSGSLGVAQDLDFTERTVNAKTPNLLNYSGNLVLSAANHSSVVPYVVGGVGGLTLFDKAALGVSDAETFLTGNVGAGVQWFKGRLGLRGDYRFVAVQSKDEAPAFFGQETRYGHRVYAALLINARR